MRKYVLPLLSLYLDFIVIDAAVGLVAYLAPSFVESLFGEPLPWLAQATISLLLLIVGRFLNVSLGDYLLSYAIAEREAGIMLRQWPNVLLGTVGFLSGLKEIVRWTLPGDGMPFLFMVEETPLKLAALITYGALYGLGGIMLLHFTRGAKLLNAALLAFGAAMMAVNLVYFRDTMVAAQINRRLNQGLPAELESAEAVVSNAPIYGGVFFALMFVLLYFCRERPAVVSLQTT